MKRKNNLDELQELELLKIEHNGCWLAFWMLFASLVIQKIFFDVSYRSVAGEWIVFMILALYLAVACVRKGIWDRRLQMNTKTNVVVSLIAALCVGAFNAAVLFRRFEKPIGSLAVSLISAAITFLLCLAALTFAMKQTKRRQDQLNAEPDEDGDVYQSSVH